MRIADATVSGSGTGAPRTSGAAPSACQPRITGSLRGSRRPGGVLAVAQPVRRDVAGVAGRQHVHVGGVAEEVDDLEGGGLLALQPHRVDRVHQRDRVVLGEPARDPQAVVEVAADHDHLGAVHDRLGELAGGDLALRHQHERLDAGPRGVRRHRGGGVAGRRADDGLGALADGDRERDGHAAVLERAGRVVALDLEPDLGAGEVGEPGRLDHRGAALAQGDRRGAVGEVEPVAVLLDHAAPLARRRGSAVTVIRWSPSTRITEDTSRTLAIAAQRLDGRGQVGVAGAVRDDDELGVVAATLLAHGLDRDVVLGERLRDRGEHAGLVVDVDLHVVAGLGLAHRQHPQVGVRRLARAADVVEPVAGDRDEVAEHRARGRRAAGAGAVEHQLAGRLALDEHRVVGLADAGQRVAPRDHRRVHAGRDGRAVGAVLERADREQLDHAAHLARPRRRRWR